MDLAARAALLPFSTALLIAECGFDSHMTTVKPKSVLEALLIGVVRRLALLRVFAIVAES